MAVNRTDAAGIAERRASYLAAQERQLRGVPSEDLLRTLVAEQRYTNALLEEQGMTARLNRGGYDGPWLAGRHYRVEGPNPIAVFAGREDPAALLIEWEGTGIGADVLYLCPDTGAMPAGYRFLVGEGGEARILVDRKQQLYALGVFHDPQFDVLLVRVREGRN